MKVEYLIFDAAGLEVRRGHCDDEILDRQAAAGEFVEIMPSEPSEYGWHRIDSHLVSAAPPPGPTIEQLRAARKEEARAYRDQLVYAGCDTPLGRVQTDEKSQANILQAMMRAQLALATAEAWSIEWRMSDDSLVAHDAQAMIAMALAVGAFKSACFAVSFAIADAIAVSDDPPSIDITAGYPGSTQPDH